MSPIVIIVALLIASALALLIWPTGETTVSAGQADPADSKKPINALLTWIGGMLVPRDEHRRLQLVAKMQQAGMYERHAPALFLGVYAVCLTVAASVAVGILLTQEPSSRVSLTVVGLPLFALLLPYLWLNAIIKRRCHQIRLALTDALDVIVVCIQGGLSLPQAVERVSQELNDVHPLLAEEMDIVHREVYLGASPGEALTHLATRFDTPNLRSLASAVLHAQKYGAPLGPTLQSFADDLRLERKQAVEKLAQKSAAKLVVPIAICFLPAFLLLGFGAVVIDLLDTLTNLL